MKKSILIAALLALLCTGAYAAPAAKRAPKTGKEYIWPKGKMPDAQSGQIAAMTDESEKPDFNPDKHRQPYLDWFEAPAKEKANGGCMIFISGGAYQSCCDVQWIKHWRELYTGLGFQCVNLVYRTPRPEGLPLYQSAWEDGQRAVRLVRSEAARRGYDPEKIGTVSMSAGSHMALLLATSSQTPAYEAIDALDTVSCHLNWAIAHAPAYVTTDGEKGPATLQGYGNTVGLSPVFKFDEKTCPVCFLHGGDDTYSPNGSTKMYRKLHSMGIPSELHLFPNQGHAVLGHDRAVEFLRQMGFVGPLESEVPIMERYNSDSARGNYIKETIWPEGRTPEFRENQCVPYIEWHFPKTLKTKAIQIIYSGGSYINNSPNGFEVDPARRYLNEMGMTVVTLKYRTPRPEGAEKYLTAWQDLQRTVKLVRSKAESYGLDPNQIGIMGSSAGGHLTLLGTTSSLHKTYWPIDDVDDISCSVQWGIGVYPAYALSDDDGEAYNTTLGCGEGVTVNPEFSFDKATCPMYFVHGDKDGVSSMNSVMVWEKMRAIGVQCELHTFALRDHCFQAMSSPGTGSYDFLEDIGGYIRSVVKFF